MIFKFILFSDEVDEFLRGIDIDADASFLDLHDAVLSSVGYSNDQMTSFFLCDEDWEKQTEITQVDMGTASDEDSYVMADTKLEEFLNDEGQKLMFVFDYMNERSFYLELKSIQTGKSLDKPVCSKSKGKAPKQLIDGLFLDDATLTKKSGSVDDFSTDDFIEEGFNDDELDGMSINDNYFND